jgi:hypothetical protein
MARHTHDTERQPGRGDRICRSAGLRVLRKPGASPLLFGKFLMNTTAFLALEDISDNLPRYDESVISVDMDETLQQAYERLEEDIRSAMKEHRGNKSLMSILLNTLLLYPDHPHDFEEIWARAFDPQTKEFERFLVATPENLSREALYAKERALIADIKEELRQGRRCQVYATYTGEKDVTQRLETVLCLRDETLDHTSESRDHHQSYAGDTPAEIAPAGLEMPTRDAETCDGDHRGDDVAAPINNVQNGALDGCGLLALHGLPKLRGGAEVLRCGRKRHEEVANDDQP